MVTVMKGSSRNKDNTTDGEEIGKRPKRKCLQWHPLLAKKILDFSEEEEEEEDEEEIEKYKDAFMKANPGYKWCPSTNRPVKTQSSTVTNRKKLWAFPSEPAKDLPGPKKLVKSEGMPQLNFAMADPTQMGGLSMLLLAGEHALTAQEVSSGTCRSDASNSTEGCLKSPLFQFAEISSNPLQRDAPTDSKENDESALYQFSEMCLASEQVKVREPGKAKLEASRIIRVLESAEQVKVKESEKVKVKMEKSQKMKSHEHEKMGTEIPEEMTGCSHIEAPALESTLVGPDSTIVKNPACCSQKLVMTNIGTLGISKPEKLKKKKKKNKLERQMLEKSPAKKACKKRQSSESDIDSVIYTIEAVAKGDWGAERLIEVPRKKICPSSTVKGNIFDKKSPKKKVKSKEKKVLKEKCVETTKEPKPPDVLNVIESKELLCEVPENIKSELLTPTEEAILQSLPEQVKVEDSDCSKKAETCGSRKSERACKGALYKTLVSEGMLTSLRANVDRGKRSSGKCGSSDHEGCWNEESWAFSPGGASGNKKLKRPKPKEEIVLGLAKLEEEFEKKFNSLPQYSPVTFDRKSASVPRKKKKTGCCSADQSRLNKESARTQEPLVGSQKRKARKNKITHLVRTADGRVSPAGGVWEEKPKEELQSNFQKASSTGMDCSKESLQNTESEEGHSITPDMPSVSAFFSLAALAEVAAMENVHRNQRTAPLPCDGQPKEMSQAPVLISCADQ